MKKKHYDVVVIGAGSGGLTSAIGFANIGKKVLLVEREHMGGECTNSGCIPSKALLHYAKTYYSAKQLAGKTEKNEAYRKNALTYVQQKITEVRESETPEQLEEKGVDVVLGEAEFLSSCTLRVGEITYAYKRAVIATGSSPRILKSPTIPEEKLLTNQNVFSLETVPERLLIIGGGPIGMELGQAFALLGSTVTMVLRENQFAQHEDRAISEDIEKQFIENGIHILYNASFEKLHNDIAYIIQNKGEDEQEVEIPCEKILVGIGRTPNLPHGLEKAGIAYDSDCILVNGQYRTSNKSVFAVGDVAQQLKFTHTADDAARQVVTYVASHGLLRPNRHKAVPKVTYTEPEIASVGYTYRGACEKYDCEDLIRIEVPYQGSDRAVTDDVSHGRLIIIARKITGVVLGANIIGPNAESLISIFTLAIDRKITLWRLRSTIFPYPTHSLLIKRAGDLFLSQTVANIKGDAFRKVKRHAPKLFALVFWISLLYAFQMYRTTHELSYVEMAKQIFETVTTTAWGPFVYMMLYAIRPLVFFPATVLTALSGALFGLPLGILYTIIGENASANFAYWIGRYFGNDFHLEDSILGNWVTALRKRPFGTVLFMRLFYVPFDLTNYGSGAVKIPWISYFFATLIGIMPGLITFVALGAGVEDITNFTLNVDSFNFVNIGIGVSTFVISLIIARFLRRWKPAK